MQSELLFLFCGFYIHSHTFCHSGLLRSLIMVIWETNLVAVIVYVVRHFDLIAMPAIRRPRYCQKCAVMEAKKKKVHKCSEVIESDQTQYPKNKHKCFTIGVPNALVWGDTSPLGRYDAGEWLLVQSEGGVGHNPSCISRLVWRVCGILELSTSSVASFPDNCGDQTAASDVVCVELSLVLIWPFSCNVVAAAAAAATARSELFTNSSRMVAVSDMNGATLKELVSKDDWLVVDPNMVFRSIWKSVSHNCESGWSRYRRKEGHQLRGIKRIQKHFTNPPKTSIFNIPLLLRSYPYLKTSSWPQWLLKGQTRHNRPRGSLLWQMLRKSKRNQSHECVCFW